MTRILFGPGTRGSVVGQIQQKLFDSGCDPHDLDGIYGHGTQEALAKFQSKLGLPETGVVDGVTWLVLMQVPLPEAHSHPTPLPPAGEYKGSVENALAQGNFD